MKVLYQSPIHNLNDNNIGFGQYRGTYESTNFMIYHPGADMGTVLGTDIYACAPGIVVYAGYNNDMGYTVIVEHDISGTKVYSIYGHMGRKSNGQDEAIFVQRGDSIDTSTHIGELGGTKGVKSDSSEIEPHLHFEIRTSLNIDLQQKNPLQGQLWWINQDGGERCNPWTTCWLDLGTIYGYDGTYNSDVGIGK